MIINEKIEVLIFKRNREYYREKGYSVDINGKITIDSVDILHNSNKFITVSCDYCSIEKKIKASWYFNSLKTYNKYACKICQMIKARETMLKRYGAEFPLQIKEINDRVKKTSLDRYGFENASSSDIVKGRRKVSNIISMGVDNPFQSDEIKSQIKQSNMKKYGVEFTAQSNFSKEKSKKKSLEKYGYDHHMKNPEFYQEFLKKLFLINNYKDTKIYYQGSYELDFLDNFYHTVKILNGFNIVYTFKGKEHSYLSDFFLPDFNLICEVKSTYTFNLHKEKNLLKKEYSIKSGYNFLFIIDKDYAELKKFIFNYEKENI